MVSPPAPGGDERDAGLSHRLRGVGHFPLGDPAEAEAVADRHFAGETDRLGAGTDLLDIEEAHLARLVQMNVEPNAVRLRYRCGLPERRAKTHPELLRYAGRLPLVA